MQKKDKIYISFIAILIAIIIFFLFNIFEKNREYSSLIRTLGEYQLKEKSFEVQRQKDSSTIATQTQTILTQEEAYELGLIKMTGEIKKLKSQVFQVQEFIAAGVDLPFIPDGFADTTGWNAKYQSGDTSKPIIDSVLANSIIVPKSFEYKSKWFSVNGVVNKKSVTLDTLRIENESTVTVGFKKTGFLKLKKEPIVEIQNTNPYMQVKSMSNVVIKDKKRLIDKKGFWFGLGSAISLILLNF
jgi:hypothetical protein